MKGMASHRPIGFGMQQCLTPCTIFLLVTVVKLRLLSPTVFPAGQQAPPQHYRFLDVRADELRGTFTSPAQSEQRLLYQEVSWRLGFDRGYSAAYLLPPVRPTLPASGDGYAARHACMVVAKIVKDHSSSHDVMT